MIFASGMRNAACDLLNDAHGLSIGGMLTGERLLGHADAVLENGMSFDQAFARRAGETRLRSLELASEADHTCQLLNINVDGSDTAYQAICAYASHFSWDGPGRPRPAISSVSDAWRRLFGPPPSGVGDPWRTSLLDAIVEDTSRWSARLPVESRRRAEHFADSLRDTERALANASRCTLPEASQSPGEPNSIAEHLDAMHRLMVLALSCDETRTITYKLGNCASNRPFPHLGFFDAHHMLSHHGGDPGTLSKLLEVERWCVGELAKLVDALEAAPDGQGGSLLDHTLILVCPEMADGDLHSVHDMTFLTIGDLGGALRTGLHVYDGSRATQTPLLRALLRGLGTPDDSFGPLGAGVLTAILK